VDVAGLTSGVIALSAGNEHACALTNTGGVKCWGDNLWGQLGDGTTINRFTPTDVTGLSSGVTTISTKDRHTCALMNTGDIKCWGLNDRGQLGDGGGGVTCGFRNSFVCRLTPVDVEGLDSGVAAVVTGSSHTCVLTATGGVKCWGGNRRGELGDGTSDGVPCPYEGSNVCRLTPVNVAGLTSGVIALSAAPNHTCVLTAASGVKCWGGYNEWGELGDGTTDGRMTPVDVVGLAGGVTAISAGHYHTCARTLSGKLKCWGNNEYGKLGDGTAWDSPIPIDVVWP
jgi:alpha-tubulin suppressor-like RCC1 family protein